MIMKLAIFLSCICACFCSRTFYSPQMCQNKSVTDCSFQFPYSFTNRCFVYNTAVCKSHGFPSWNLKPYSQPTSQYDAPFNVSITPYAAYKFEIQKDNPHAAISAINITLNIFDKGISGFSMMMTENHLSKNICRIFDFRNTSDNLLFPATFYYDCLHYLVETGLENVTMTFRMFPVNVELIYFVHIPPKPMDYSKSVCDWKPLVMIFSGSLHRNAIQMKFSNAPENMNIQEYVVTLLDYMNDTVEDVTISKNITDMISCEFPYVKKGHYIVSIRIVSAEGRSCRVFKSTPFFVGVTSEEYSSWIIGGIFVTLFVLMIPLFIVFLFYNREKLCYHPYDPHHKQSLWLIYSHDCIEHKELMQAFIEHIEKNYPIKVYTIYGISGNPHKWLQEKDSSTSVAVFVLSEGMRHTFDHKNSPQIEEFHHWEFQLSQAISYIFEARLPSKNYVCDTKEICKISFSYSGNQHIPARLERRGPLFSLPDDIDEFIGFVLGIPPCKLSCLNPFYKTVNKRKFEKDERLQENLNNMEDAVFKNLHIHYIDNEDKSQSSDVKGLGKIFNYKDESENIDIASARDPMSTFFNLEDLVKENMMDFSKPKSDFENLEEDPVAYFTFKELQSG